MYIYTFYSTEEGQTLKLIRTYLQSILPVCGDLLIGETRIRRVPLGEVNVPSGAQVLISNNRHAFTPSTPEDMRLRRNALLDQVFTYDLLNLNCEHFATFVRYGKAVCNQVKICHCKNISQCLSFFLCIRVIVCNQIMFYYKGYVHSKMCNYFLTQKFKFSHLLTPMLIESWGKFYGLQKNSGAEQQNGILLNNRSRWGLVLINH